MNEYEMPDVDFGYAFAPPHRLTLSVPSGSYKTLADFRHECLTLSRSNYTLADYEPNIWQTPPVSWKLQITPYAQGATADISEWKRMGGGVPGFAASGGADGFGFGLSGIATAAGDAIKVSVSNGGGAPIICGFTIEHKGGWVISNQGWIDGSNKNVLTAQVKAPLRIPEAADAPHEIRSEIRSEIRAMSPDACATPPEIRVLSSENCEARIEGGILCVRPNAANCKIVMDVVL